MWRTGFWRTLSAFVWTKRLRRGMGERAGLVALTGRRSTVVRFWSDTLGVPAVAAGVFWLPRTKEYHDVRAQNPHDPGHATRRAGRRNSARVSAGCPPIDKAFRIAKPMRKALSIFGPAREIGGRTQTTR